MNSSLIFTVLLSFSLLLSAQVIKVDPVIRLCQSPGMFAMTFDQGPSIYTGAILDAFASRNAKATFHPVVTYLSEATVVANLQRAAAEGHTIGLSIEANVDLSSQSDTDIMGTIDSRANTIKSIIGVKPYFLRIPNYSNMTDSQINLIFSKGYILTTYNLDSYDYASPNVLQSFKNVLEVLSNNTKGAFISVQRDYIQDSANATPDILDYISSKGYSLVPLDKCIRNAPAASVPSKGNTSGPNASAPINVNTDTSDGIFEILSISALFCIIATVMLTL